MIVHLLTYAMPSLFVAWKTSATTVNTLSQLIWQHFVDFICKCNKAVLPLTELFIQVKLLVLLP